MIIRGDILLFPCTLALITLVAVSACATSVGAQGGMFSAGDGYERFMGRWSRELAPLFGEIREGAQRRCRTGRRIGNRRSDGGYRRGCPVESHHRH